MYERTYRTIKDIYGRIVEKGCKAYLIGGISAAIQTNTDLYRQNQDLDIMINIKDLPGIKEELKECGYEVYDKRNINTGNYIDKDGVFHPVDHEVNAVNANIDLLGIGIFLYKIENNNVILNSYAYDERIGKTVGSRKEIPLELFELMYSNEFVDYHGTKVLSSSKEYTYITKKNGEREKDKIDASILKPFIGEKEQEKINRITLLQRRIKRYEDTYSKKGELETTIKYPELEDVVYKFISKYSSDLKDLSQKEILSKLILEDNIQTLIKEREDIRFIFDELMKLERIDDLAVKSKEIAHIYCYSDDLEKDIQKYKRDNFKDKLTSFVYTEKEIVNNAKINSDNNKYKNKNDIIK